MCLLVGDTFRLVLLVRRTGCLLFEVSHTTDAESSVLSCLKSKCNDMGSITLKYTEFKLR